MWEDLRRSGRMKMRRRGARCVVSGNLSFSRKGWPVRTRERCYTGYFTADPAAALRDEPMHRHHFFSAICVLGLLTSACSSSDDKTKGFGSVTQKATFVAGGSIGQVWITDAKTGDVLVLVDKGGSEVARGTADRLGSLILRGIQPGAGYTVRLSDTPQVGTDAFPVLSRDEVPPSSLYDQVLQPGINYVKMRDG